MQSALTMTTQIPKVIYQGTRHAMGLPTLLAELVGMTSGTIAIDVETVSLRDRTPIGIGIANAPNNAFYFPIPSTIIPWALLKNPNITKVLHNGHFDLMVIKAHFGVDVENFVDTIVAARLLGYPPALGKLAKDFFDIDIPSIDSLIGKKGKSQLTMDQIPIDKVANKCAMDCQNTLALWDQFKNAVPPKAFDLEMKVMPVIMDIQRRGIRIDKVKLQAHIDRITKEVDWYRAIAKGYGFNPGSSKQIAAILQGHGWQIMYDRKTKNPKMDKDTLDRYYGEDPLARLAIIYKGQASLLNNTLRPILDKHLVGDRIHPNINQNVAETGRFSTSNPNVNNITEILRDIVIPADGMMFEDWDLCLSEGTLVETPYGPTKIEELEPGDMVFGYGKDRPNATHVVAKKFSGYRDCVKVTLDNNKSFIATPNHKMVVRKGGESWDLIKVENLSVGDRLLPFRRIETPDRRFHLYGHSNRKYIKEHIAVVNSHYGHIPPGYEVHHINGNPKDNRPENLELLKVTIHRSRDAKRNYILQDHTSRLERLRFALKVNRRSYVGKGNPNYGKKRGTIKECLKCGTEFYCYPSQPKIYCSNKCYNKAKIEGLNHLVVKIEPVGIQPTWDIEIEGNHLFALSCGAISHNSQIELRDIAYLSQDPEMLKVFADPNGDIHSETSNFVFGDHSPYHRQLAKAINFAIIYGGDAYTLYINNNVPYHIGEQYLYTYFQRFSRLKEWIEQTKAFAHANGYTETLLGRRRSHQDINAPEIWKRAKAERELINHPVQGSAAEHLKELTWRLRDQLQDNLIHDESLMERYPHKVPDYGVVDNLAPFKTPADVKVGDNWKDVKKIMTIGV